MTERSLFLAVLDMDDPAKRSAYLDQACAGNPALRMEVEQLLQAHLEPGRFMERPAPALVNHPSPPWGEGPGVRGGATVDEPILERPGTLIGPYRLMEEIGAGGFGLVFVAEQQQPVRRKVALKVIKPGMDTREVIARFEAERQALALMDHPNIAHVFEGGTTPSGRPYFVMELVRGVPITDFCDQNQHSIRERLALFMDVCQAVQHAHQKGIIHRDLKPSNIMVTLHDDKPVVKVIDFGVAKAVGQQLTEKTVYTRFTQMIGTPQYMSPEQAGMSGLDIDTRTDIYALGVLLYELLTGATPFDKERLRTATFEEIRRIIREEEPPKPSTRFSTLDQAASTVSANRKSDPHRLSRLIRGELDWIVMKALEKDRNRRYESASAFAADVQRYLHDEPVQACPPSAGYRFRKFARRNKAALATTTAIALAVLLTVAGLAASTVLTASALQSQIQAKKEIEKALEREQLTLYFQRVKTAAREFAAKNLGRAEQSLDQCIPLPGQPDLRGWEWHYLKRRRYQEPRNLRHPDVVLSVACSPNGLYLAAGGLDGTVIIWDSQTWKPVYTWKGRDQGHDKHVYGLAFSPDSRYLATGGDDRKVLVWDLRTGSLLYTLEGHTATIRQLAFSPDGQRLASASEDKSVRLWVMQTQESFVFLEHGDAVRGVAFDALGRVVSASADAKVKVWDPDTGAVAATYRGQLRWVSVMAFHVESQRLALGSWDGTVELWDGLPAKEVHTLLGHTMHITSLAFSPNGRRFVSAGDDRGLIVWETTAGQEALALDLGNLTPIGAAFSADAHRLAVGCGQRCAMVYDGTP